jgi:hypothetical protein
MKRPFHCGIVCARPPQPSVHLPATNFAILAIPVRSRLPRLS